MRLLFFLAIKALLRSRLSLFFLVLAVAAGVAFQIPNAANLNGYTEELIRQGVIRATGHVLITGGQEPLIPGAGPLKRRILGQSFVRGVSLRLERAGVLFRGENYQALRVVGIEVDGEQSTFGICRRLAHGKCLSRRQEDRVLLGHRLAQQQGLALGDRFKLVLPYEDLGELKFASEKFFVEGILRGGGGFSTDYDLFLPIQRMRQMLGTGDEATKIVVFVDDPARAAHYAAGLRSLIHQGRAEPWWAVDEFVANAIAGNRVLLMISMIMVTFAVGIPILALLYIHVLHDRKQIAILAALGFTKGDLFTIYLFKAIAVGIIGGALGIVGGLGLCTFFYHYPLFKYSGFAVYPALNTGVITIPAGVLLVVTVLSGLAPAIKAARANPTLELRED